MSSEDNGSGDDVAPAVTPSAAPAPSALCAVHPGQAAIGTCARCGNYYCGTCAGRRTEREGFCNHCYGVQGYVAWEDTSLSLWQRYYRTLRSSLVEMPKFAAELPVDGGLGQPLLYALLPTAVSVLIGTSLMSLMVAFALGMAPQQAGAEMPPAGWMGAIMFVMYGAMGIGGLLAYLFVWPAVLLGTARIFGNQHLRYEGVYRALCYACGFNCLYFVPLLGMAVLGYHAVLASMAIGAQGRTSLPVGLAIYGVPALVLAGCCCGGYFGIIMLAVQADR